MWRKNTWISGAIGIGFSFAYFSNILGLKLGETLKCDYCLLQVYSIWPLTDQRRGFSRICGELLDVVCRIPKKFHVSTWSVGARVGMGVGKVSTQGGKKNWTNISFVHRAGLKLLFPVEHRHKSLDNLQNL